MEFSQFSEYTIQGALSCLLMVVAYKLYRLRISTSSSCCGEHVNVATMSRGDSSHDLEMIIPQRPRTITITGRDEEEDNDIV